MGKNVPELKERIEELEHEVAKFYHNCVEIQTYQAKLLDIAEYWTQWMSNGEHLVHHEAAVLALPTGLERMLIEERRRTRKNSATNTTPPRS